MNLMITYKITENNQLLLEEVTEKILQSELSSYIQTHTYLWKIEQEENSSPNVSLLGFLSPSIVIQWGFDCLNHLLPLEDSEYNQFAEENKIILQEILFKFNAMENYSELLQEFTSKVLKLWSVHYQIVSPQVSNYLDSLINFTFFIKHHGCGAFNINKWGNYKGNNISIENQWQGQRLIEILKEKNAK